MQVTFETLTRSLEDALRHLQAADDARYRHVTVTHIASAMVAFGDLSTQLKAVAEGRVGGGIVFPSVLELMEAVAGPLDAHEPASMFSGPNFLLGLLLADLRILSGEDIAKGDATMQSVALSASKEAGMLARLLDREFHDVPEVPSLLPAHDAANCYL